MKKPKTITEKDIRRFLKKNGPTSLVDLAEHFGAVARVVTINKSFRDFIWQVLRKNSGVGLDENWKLVAARDNNDINDSFHLLQRWALNDASKDIIKHD